MFKRARISLLIALVIATGGFLGWLDLSVARILFYLFIAVAVLSVIFGFFEDETPAQGRFGDAALQTRRIKDPQPHHAS